MTWYNVYSLVRRSPRITTCARIEWATFDLRAFSKSIPVLKPILAECALWFSLCANTPFCWGLEVGPSPLSSPRRSSPTFVMTGARLRHARAPISSRLFVWQLFSQGTSFVRTGRPNQECGPATPAAAHRPTPPTRRIRSWHRRLRRRARYSSCRRPPAEQYRQWSSFAFRC